ncbi:MAG: hypothetical protein IT427_10975 [Pirellulales bacterium]|nr:hypothetical protein [Pirellulales bacterium]
MSTSNNWTHEDNSDDSFAVTYTRRDESRDLKMRKHAFERRSARPRSVNGIHRRRNKRFAW